VAENKARAFFALMGYHFNPDTITALLEMEPTSSNADGMRGTPDKPTISSWEISTDEVTGDVDVYALTDIITKKIEPIKDKIKEACEIHNMSPRLGVVLTLSVDKGEVCPDVGFGGRTTRLMAEIGAFMNIDYQLSERI